MEQDSWVRIFTCEAPNAGFYWVLQLNLVGGVRGEIHTEQSFGDREAASEAAKVVLDHLVTGSVDVPYRLIEETSNVQG